jgi:hypothetical protein
MTTINYLPFAKDSLVGLLNVDVLFDGVAAVVEVAEDVGSSI